MLFGILNLGELSFLMLLCSVCNNIASLVTKGYHGCKCCGTSIKARWSNHLRKTMYDCSKAFLLEDHPYRRVASDFNGKPERTQRPKIMTPTNYIRAYDIENEKEFVELFDSNGEPLFNDLEFLTPMLRKCQLG